MTISCATSNKKFRFEQLSDVYIEELSTGDLKNITDTLWINSLCNDYLYRSKKQACKFMPVYKVHFKTNNESYYFLISGDKCFKNNGITYTSKRSIFNHVDEIFNE